MSKNLSFSYPKYTLKHNFSEHICFKKVLDLKNVKENCSGLMRYHYAST